MTTTNINIDLMTKKIEELKELEALIEEAKAQADSLKDDIKSVMNENALDTLEVGSYVVRYTPVSSSRFDTKRFKEEFGEDLYKKYTKEVLSNRFSIA